MPTPTPTAPTALPPPPAAPRPSPLPAGRPLSVGLYTYSTQPRGSVVHTAHVAEALAEAGCEVTVYALDKDGRGFFRPLRRARVCLIPAAPAPATTAELVRLRAAEVAAYLARRAPAHDLDHAEDCLTASGLLEARARGREATLVRTVHHVERFEDPYLAHCQERSIREADLRLTVSRAAADDVDRTFGMACPVVGNGVDFERFRRADAARVAIWRARLGGVAGPLVLAVGGVEERKNTLATLRAFVLLRQIYPHARLWILGGATVLDHGAYRRAFEALRDELDPAARAAVVELGVVHEDEVPALFQLADVVALPSLHEGFGLAALEALAAGTPLVASDRPPFTEFLDADCAILVDPRSERSIAEGLFGALAGPAPDRLARGRQRARTHSWTAVAVHHLSQYERTIDHARDALRGPLA